MSYPFRPELRKMLSEELQGDGLCQPLTSVFFLSSSLKFAIQMVPQFSLHNANLLLNHQDLVRSQ